MYLYVFGFVAVGSRTTYYNALDHGDPNADFNKRKEEGEVQYFIKWKSWSHIHDTWENEQSLIEQKINGMKKLENFQKRERELREWFVQMTIFLLLLLATCIISFADELHPAKLLNNVCFCFV